MKTYHQGWHLRFLMLAVLFVERSAVYWAAVGILFLFGAAAQAQMIDNTQATNNAKAGINKSLADEIGAGRGDIDTLNSSLFIINRDPFRAKRWQRISGIEETESSALPCKEYFYRFQTARPRTELLRAQLGWNPSKGISHPTLMGCGICCALRS